MDNLEGQNSCIDYLFGLFRKISFSLSIFLCVFSINAGSIVPNTSSYCEIDGLRYLIQSGMFNGFGNSSFWGDWTHDDVREEAATAYNDAFDSSKYYGSAILMPKGIGQSIIPYDIEGEISVPETIEYEGHIYLVQLLETSFYNCTRLTEVNLPNSIGQLNGDSFYNCRSLKRIIIPEYVTEIPSNSFNGCESLEEVYISKYVWVVGRWTGNETDINVRGWNDPDGCFQGCEKIKKIVCQAIKPPYCESKEFTQEVYKSATLYVPESSIGDYQQATGWKNFLKIESIDNENVGIIRDLNIENPITESDVRVYSLDGKLLHEGPLSCINVPKGLYIVSSGISCQKIMIP